MGLVNIPGSAFLCSLDFRGLLLPKTFFFRIYMSLFKKGLPYSGSPPRYRDVSVHRSLGFGSGKNHCFGAQGAGLALTVLFFRKIFAKRKFFYDFFMKNLVATGIFFTIFL